MDYIKTKVYSGIIIVGIFLCIPTFLFAFATPAGLVDSGVWLSGEPKVNETVTIYSAVFNGYDKTLSGTVQFYDYNTLLGEKNFSIPAKSIATPSISWKVNLGDHKLQARVVNPNLKTGSGDDAVFLDWHKTNELKFTSSPSSNATIPAKDADASNKSDNSSLISSIGDTLSNSVDGIGTFISEKTPTGIKDTTSSVFGTVETFRIKKADSFAVKKDEVKKEYDAIKNNTSNNNATGDGNSGSSENKLQKPLKLISLAGVSAAKIAFNSPYIFYSLLVIIIFLILRAIWRWFRKEDFGSSDDE